MGYSYSPMRVERMKAYLNSMLTANHELRWKSENTHMLAYHIREALVIAEKKSIVPYSKLKSLFIVKNLGSYVSAVRRTETPDEVGANVKLTLSEIENVEGVVGAVILHKANEMFFPDCVLNDAEAKVLFDWASPLFYNLVIGESGTTVTKNDPGDAAWKPE